MELSTAIKLIQNEKLNKHSNPQLWADLGCGSGLFTHALATLLPDNSTVYAIDKSDNFERSNSPSNNKTNIIFTRQDIELEAFNFPLLDGILMANILHYIKDKSSFLQKLKKQAKPGASLLVVEYDTDLAVPVWVPYPISFSSLKLIFADAEIHDVTQLGRVPSQYRRDDIYSALIKI